MSNHCQIIYESEMVYNIDLNINQLDALNFIMIIFHASTFFEHMCSKHVVG